MGRRNRKSISQTPLTTKVEGSVKDEDDIADEDLESLQNEVIRRRQPEVLLNMDLIKALIAPYDGRGDCEEWIGRLENFQNMYTWSGLATMTYAISRLEGTAKVWYDAHRGDIWSWDDLKVALANAFPNHVNEAKIHFEMQKFVRPKEMQYEVYVYRMMEMAKPAKLSTTAIVTYIVRGLNNTAMQTRLKGEYFEDCQDLINFIKRYEAATMEDEATERKPLDWRVAEGDIRCNYCNNRGHFARDCRLRAAVNTRKADTGAAARQPMVQGPLAGPSKEIGVAVIDEGRDQSEFKIVVNNIEIRTVGLIDTGSPITLIHISVVRNAGVAIEAVNFTEKYVGINNSEISFKGAVRGELFVDDDRFPCYFRVVLDDTMKAPLLVGRDFVVNNGLKAIYDGKMWLERSSQSALENRKAEEGAWLKSVMSIGDFDDNAGLDVNCFDIGDANIAADVIDEVKHAVKECYLDAQRPQYPKVCFKMKIDLLKEEPFSFTPRRLSYSERSDVEKIVTDLLSKKIIKESSSPYASRILLVKKKNGENRMCVDFRSLNKLIVKDRFPMPVIEDHIDKLQGKKYFSTLDLKSGFFHIPIDENCTHYTSFVTHMGQFEFTRVPFGLCNSPAVFMRFINLVFKDLIRDGKIVVYMDDVMIATATIEEHIQILREVLSIMNENKLELQISKCEILKTNVSYLGYEVDQHGVSPSKRHVQALEDFPVPRSVVEVQRFIGLTSYFRKFIQSFSSIAHPLYELVRQNTFCFDEACLKSFQELKDKLVCQPVLAIYSPSAKTELYTDASALGFGGILMQEGVDGNMHPVMYFSKRASDAESRLHSFELETLAVVYCLQRFHVYLYGLPSFDLITDCNSLVQTLNKKDINPKIARWSLFLSNYNFTMKHRESHKMHHVDALSRCYMVGVVEECDSLSTALIACQLRDSNIEKIRTDLEKQEHKLFELRDGLVYRKDGPKLLFYVPDEMESSLLFEAHEKMGHFGNTKMLEYLRRQYWFPKMSEKAKKHVENCIKCIIFTKKQTKHENYLKNIDKGVEPFDTIHVDHMGPLQVTPRRNKHIFAVVDAFTRFIKLYATKSTGSKEVIKCLENYFVQYSVPRRIVSDRGTCFTSDEFRYFVDSRSVKHVLTGTANPQANGAIERFNRVIAPVLSKIRQEGDEQNWDNYLNEVEFYLNNTFCRSVDNTPSMVLFGVNQRRGQETSILGELHMESNNDRGLEQIREAASKKSVKVQDTNKKYFDAKVRTNTTFKQGDFVMLKNNPVPGVNFKLQPKNRGPYMVKECLDNDRYVVTDIPGMQISQRPFQGILGPNTMSKWKPSVVNKDLDLSEEIDPSVSEVDSENEEFLGFDEDEIFQGF